MILKFCPVIKLNSLLLSLMIQSVCCRLLIIQKNVSAFISVT